MFININDFVFFYRKGAKGRKGGIVA